MSEHTPGRKYTQRMAIAPTESRNENLDCRCVLFWQGSLATFHYCPLHLAAPDLLAALRELVDSIQRNDGDVKLSLATLRAYEQAEAAIEKAKEGRDG